MDYYSVPVRDEPSIHRKTWRNLKCILLSERNQSEKATYCMIPTVRNSENLQRLYKDQWLPKVSGGGREG